MSKTKKHDNVLAVHLNKPYNCSDPKQTLQLPITLELKTVPSSSHSNLQTTKLEINK
jgi:hypothetical protein